jgi:quercetin dioxygenase-like cupin family protein
MTRSGHAIDQRGVG